MAKIVVFDSGLGSLSIIKEIQKISKNDIIYFADQKNYPYGVKSQAQFVSLSIQKINDLRGPMSCPPPGKVPNAFYTQNLELHR